MSEWAAGVDDCIDVLWSAREAARVGLHSKPDPNTQSVVDHCLKLLRGLKDKGPPKGNPD